MQFYCRNLIFFSLLLLALPAQAVTKITFWHSMNGQLNTALNHIIEDFNHSQSQYRVEPVYKGGYAEVLTNTVAAFRVHQAPDIVQIYDIGTATMLNPPGAVIPVHQLLKETGTTLNSADFFPTVKSYYSDHDGLVAMPFNCSVPVLYYNKDIFKKAHLDPNQAPKTWPELANAAASVVSAGYSCGFTAAWPSWILMEAFSAAHNLPYATAENGFSGVNAMLLFNNSMLKQQIATLAQWEKKKWFVYGGRDDNPQSLFTSAKCAMMMQSSGSLIDLTHDLSFRVGVAPLPYLPNLASKQSLHKTLIGGAAIWVMNGRRAEVKQGIAMFLKFLALPQIQARWQRQTGYLPISKTAFAVNQQNGFYQRNPDALVVTNALATSKPTAYSRGSRLGNYIQLRELADQSLEKVFSGDLSAASALDEAVLKGNHYLRKFRLNVGGNG